MAETRDSRLLIEAAEAAAAAGDLAGAGRLLRELAEVQHATLGPDHPELAHTLNNLGVVHERLAHLDEAEACYRHAHTIAVASLAPDHPFVDTSGRNLREFCAAHGRAVGPPVVKESARAELLPPPPVPDAPPSSDATPPPPPRPSRADVIEEPPRPRRAPTPAPAPAPAPSRSRSPLPPAPPPPSTRSMRGPLVAALGIALVVVAALLVRFWSESKTGAGFTEVDNTRPAASSPPTPNPATPPATPTPTPTPPATATPPATVAPPSPAKLSPPPGASPAVVEARVCSKLSTRGRWDCEPVSGSTGAGTLFFYTRLKSASNAVVEHRWYQGDRLRRTVELRVSANPSAGYRTFSRQTIPTARAGDWRVELRAKDGTLLGEERFTVRPSKP